MIGMNRTAVMAVMLVAVGCASPGTGHRPAVTAAQRARAASVLDGALSSAEGWEIIHAAESSLAAGRRAGVEPALRQAQGEAPGVLGLGVGVWRVRARLAQTPRQRREAVAAIRRVLHTPGADDRLHAVESLARLGEPMRPSDAEAVEAVHRAGGEGAEPFILWFRANAQGPASVRDRLVELLRSGSTPTVVRAAFALRHLGPVTPAQWRAIGEAVAQHRDDPVARGYLLTARFALASDPAVRDRARREVLAALPRAPTAVRYEWGKTLADTGSSRDLSAALSLLDDAALDPRISGAEAVLRIAVDAD